MKEEKKRKMKKLLFIVFKRLNEYIPLVLSILLWYFSGKYIEKHFPMSVSDDVGIIQEVVFKIIIYFVAVTASWVALRLVFPKIGEYVDNHFGDELDLFRSNKDIKQNHFAMIITVVMFFIYFIGSILIFMN